MTNTTKPPAPAQPAANNCTCAGCGIEYFKPLPVHKYEAVRLCFACASIWENTEYMMTDKSKPNVINLNEHLKKYSELTEYGYRPTAPRIECPDGWSVSIQAGRMLYSTPRDDTGPYTHVEAGFPTTPPPEWAEWGDIWEEGDIPDVYGYLPIEIAEKVINAHMGGSDDRDN